MGSTELLAVEEKNEQTKREKIVARLKILLKKVPWKKTILITLFFLAVYFSMELLNGNDVIFTKIFGIHTSWEERSKYLKYALSDFFKFPKFICNFFIYVFLYWIVYGLTNRTKLSCTLVSTVAVIFGIINYIVTEVRGIAITISDIYSVRTAMNVAKGIRPDLEGNFYVGIFLFILANFILWKFCKFDDNRKNKTKKRKIMTSALGVAGILFFLALDPLMNDVYIWDINASYANSGPGLTLMKLFKDLKIDKPSGYNSSDVKNLLAQYEDETNNVEQKLPNVVVVMNESFADLEKVFNYEPVEDNIPYFHELMKKENIISGTMHTSEYGGGTANVEYQYLTQNTTAFLPTGSMPYQQYISGNVNQSVVTYMNKLNYNSYGIHSWNKNGYSRGKIYKFLQFDHAMFREDMPNLRSELNEYSTDISTYNYWFDIMNNKTAGEKNFTFIVTVQNHTPFNKVDAGRTQYVQDNESLNAYLQYQKMSDDALKELISYIENYEEDIILLFFGDHQPNLKLEEKCGSNGVYSVEESSYVVPFFIWANYDIEEKSGIETSPNYLQNLLVEAGNLPKDSYTKYIEELREEIPVITTQYYIGKNGKRYEVNDEKSPYYEKVKEYEKVIYYQMFDNK